MEKSPNSTRGVSYGGGQSSLGYLFGDDKKQQKIVDLPPSSAVLAPPYGIDDEANENNPSQNSNTTSITYQKSQGQNSGIFITNGTSMFSPSDTIKKFYSSINNKDMNQLELLIAKDCFFDDFSYAKPFQGRKEALKFLGQLTICMGNNTEFCIEHIYEGVDLTIVVNWHLEWNKKQVPFTRGCSCYELSRDGEGLVIRKAQVIVESPIKPGSLALEVFQKVISVCDAFPEAGEWLFLMSPLLFQSIYNIDLWPSIRPILAWYRKLWSIIVTILTHIYTTFLFIIKKFHQ